jgi:hypothetical protein
MRCATNPHPGVAAIHRRAADLHDRAAAFFAAHGDGDRADRERRLDEVTLAPILLVLFGRWWTRGKERADVGCVCLASGACRARSSLAGFAARAT